MKFAGVIFSLLFLFPTAQAQSPKQDFSDPVALLRAVARTYASGADTFHLESIEEDTSESNKLEHDWRKTYRTAIKGPGDLYRIETRSPFGSYIQDSDGSFEWIYQVEANLYVKHPVPQEWPHFPKIFTGGDLELRSAWTARTWLEAEAARYHHATMLPPETIDVERHHFNCYVVHVTDKDADNRDKETSWDSTFWIDREALVFRKQVRHSDGYMIAPSKIHIPFHRDETVVYPVTELDQTVGAGIFRFTPPEGAKEVSSFEPDYAGSAPSHPKTSLVGTTPEVTFTAQDGKKISLSFYRGKPLLIDLWATWCGPCLMSMPTLQRVYLDAKDKGLAIVTVDEDNAPENATAYLTRHHYTWVNFHDTGNAIEKAFKESGIPLTLLIDAQGKIVYEDFGGDEAGLRKAIAALGPEFASVATPSKPALLR